MSIKRIISVLLIILSMSVCLTSCGKKGVNILKQPKDYVGEFNVPSSKKVDNGTALSIVAKINENTFKITDAVKTNSDDTSVIESYRINCYGVSIELFHYNDNSQRLKEAKEQGKFIIRSEQGEILKEYTAIANGNFVLVFSSTKDSYGNDCTESNNKVADYFKSLEL